MSLLELRGFLRLAVGLRPFLSQTIAAEEARKSVVEWVNTREDRLLEKIEHAVFGFSASPYLKLFRAAGCEWGDVQRLVRADGVEGALKQLLNAGIYVSWDEMRGRQPVKRGSLTFEVNGNSFDNPMNRSHYYASSGGTSGKAVRAGIDLEDHAESAPDWAVWFAARGWLGRPLIFWTPTHTGMANRYLKCAKFGAPYIKWFASANMASLHDRFRSTMVHGLVRSIGGYSKPVPVPVDAPEVVGRYLLDLLEKGQKPLVNTAPSSAAQLSIDIQKRGRSLQGVTFLLGAEPVTKARRETIEACGALAAPTYGTSEGGWMGAQFAGAEFPDEVHIFRDAYAVIARDEPGDEDTTGVPILLTNLRRASPKVLINAEIGDTAIIASGANSPEASELGYDVRIHTIRSFRKITAWGITIAIADIYRVLEETLPRILGGTLQDYQLVEEQDENGLSSLRLLVGHRVGPVTDERLREVFLKEVSKMRPFYGFMTNLVSDAGALRIERREPIATNHGKVLPVLPHRAR